jgi:tetratricopeptide (TPR) repeat protein
MARCNLGDPGGVEDYRAALEIATEAGQGREVALLHNNLGIALWIFEGPGESLEVLRDGIGFAQARGLVEMLDSLMASQFDVLYELGDLDEALEVAARVAERLEASGDVYDLSAVRAAQARIFALRGEAAQVADAIEWLEPVARGTQAPEIVVSGLGTAAIVRAALGQDDAATALLTELESYPNARDNQNYPAFLPPMVRTALGMGQIELTEQLVSGLDVRYPYAEHALVAANAALTEANGDLSAAADGYAEAADRWERFGIVLEEAFALLGQGRCLLGLSRATEAAHILQHAREIFDWLQAAPAVAETDALLQQATALSS